MTVSDLIEKLKTFPPDLRVLTYSTNNEDWANARNASIISKEDQLPYFKADPTPAALFPFILISD